MTALYIYVPGEPVGWQRTASHGKVRFDTPRNKAVKQHIGLLAKQAMQGRAMLSGALRCEITAWMPVPESWSKRKKAEAFSGRLHHTSKPDADNLCKVVLDALNNVAWRDDAAVVDLRCFKKYGSPVQTVIVVEAI
jgi:Holliday junction resolvase RusA-like endonuclease